MGRPRKYGSGAERQRAFRQRLEEDWARVDRRGLERLNERLIRLQLAVSGAALSGDETARECAAGSVDTVLERLIGHFEARAGARGRQEAG